MFELMFIEQSLFFSPDPNITSAHVLQLKLHADEESYRSMAKEPTIKISYSDCWRLPSPPCKLKEKKVWITRAYLNDSTGN
jgi:hypothetical protein